MQKLEDGKNNSITCRDCGHGKCCREGVEVDLFEVADILRLPLDITKPWFRYLGRDKSFPSGYKFSTILRDRRCVFQDNNKRCLIYEARPKFCVEFPLEGGRVAPHYHELCHHGSKKKKKAARRRG